MSSEPRDQNAPDETAVSAAAATQPEAPAQTEASTQTPVASATVADEAPVAAAARPKPAYGEYAPDGWTWTPPADATATAAADTAPTGANTPTGASNATHGRVSGVPHNLGARGSQPQAAAPQASPVPAEAAQPTTTPAQSQARQSQHYQAAAPLGAPAPAKRGSADRVISILLLVIGAFGALNMALTLMTLPETLNIFASAAELEDFVLPESLGALATVGAISILAIYAVNLILTIQRMRTGKVTFWVPLVAAAVAFIVSMIIMFVSVSMSPELLVLGSDPELLAKVMEKLSAPVS